MVKSRLHPVAVAVGLIAGGLAALVVSSWDLDDDFSDAGPGFVWIQVLTVAAVVGAVAVFALRHKPIAVLSWGFAVVGLAVTVLAVIGFIAQYSSGFPGMRTLFAAVGGLAVTVGAVVLSRVPAGRWRLPSAASGLFGFVALFLVPVVAWPLMTATPDWRLVATTASAGEPAAVPESVSKVAWSADVDGPIREVQAAGMGGVVLLDDGAIGVDGTTGQIRWSRRWAGAKAESMDVSPDGRTVMLQMSPADRFPIRREVLDAVTGELRFAKDSANEQHSVGGFHTPMTNASYIGADEDTFVFYGYSLTDGHRLWEYRIPSDCAAMGGKSDQFATADAMLVPLACNQKEFRYVALDGATGLVRWQYTVEFPKGFSRSNLDISESPDHKLVKLWLRDSADPYVTLDSQTGTVVSKTADLIPYNDGLGIAGKPKNETIVDVRSGRVVAGNGPVLDCALHTGGGGLLSGGALCVSSTDSLSTTVRTTATLEFNAVRFGDATVTPLSVPLGGPFGEVKIGTKPYVVRPGYGAVFVYSEFVLAEGNRYRLVGLR
jgi:hypothetical protein